MPRILVALDGTPGSEKALDAAVKLAQQNGGQLAAVTVLDYSSVPHRGALTEGIKAKARRHLAELLQTATNFAVSRGVRLTPILREGHPAEAIIACAEEEGADLLVLGSSSGTVPHPGLGGTAAQVSGHCPCTVMLVK